MERLGTQFPVQKGTNGLPTWRLCTSPDVTSLIIPGSSNGCPIDYPTLCKQVSRQGARWKYYLFFQHFQHIQGCMWWMYQTLRTPAWSAASSTRPTFDDLAALPWRGTMSMWDP